MSYGDKVVEILVDFVKIGEIDICLYVVMVNEEKKYYGV